MDTEQFVIAFFERHGFSIEKIPEGDRKTPDFLAEIEKEKYVIELKTKNPNDEQVKERGDVLLSGGIHQTSEEIIPQDRLHAIVKDAKDQLAAYDTPKGAFNLPWFICTGHLDESRREQFEATLYGSTSVGDWGSGDGLRTCYYFYNSEFYRYRDTLDAAIVSDLTEARLCVNTHSRRYEEFLESRLAQLVGAAVVDPNQEEAAGLAYLIDSDVDRSNKSAVLAYLKDKYNLNMVMDLHMKHYTGTVRT